MEKMEEKDFDRLEKSDKLCPGGQHEVVKLYYLGTHSDYGCKKCGFKSLNKEDFNK